MLLNRRITDAIISSQKEIFDENAKEYIPGYIQPQTLYGILSFKNDEGSLKFLRIKDKVDLYSDIVKDIYKCWEYAVDDLVLMNKSILAEDIKHKMDIRKSGSLLYDLLDNYYSHESIKAVGHELHYNNLKDDSSRSGLSISELEYTFFFRIDYDVIATGGFDLQFTCMKDIVDTNLVTGKGTEPLRY